MNCSYQTHSEIVSLIVQALLKKVNLDFIQVWIYLVELELYQIYFHLEVLHIGTILNNIYLGGKDCQYRLCTDDNER